MTAALTAAPMAAGTQVHEYKRTIALYEGSRTPGMDLFDFTTEIAHGVVVPTCTGPFSWQNTMMINATLILLSTKVNYALAAVKSLGKEATAKHVLPTIEPRQIRDNLQRATYSSPEEYEKIC